MRGEFYQQLTNDLETARAEGLFKEERIITSAQQADITVADGSHVINFCANNYLGLANHPELIAAAKANGIDYAADVYPHYGSDVEATLRGGADARHALIGAGVYASHGYERSHVDGVKNTLELLAAYLDK